MPVSTADLVSPAMACLRVSIVAAPGGHSAKDLQALVAKVINAFLETRWAWPRQFEQMTPYAFVLTDPRASHMDKRGLKALAAELQLKLFGADGDGEVSLLMFEGTDVEVHRFAKLAVEDVERMLAGQIMNPPFEGVLDRITADDARPASPPRAAEKGFEDIAFDPPPRPSTPKAEAKFDQVYGGLYLTLTHSFVGSLALCRRSRRDRHWVPDLGSPEALPGVSAEAFDEGCVESALQALSQDAAGLLFVPVSFSSLVKPAGRRAYARFLCHLPAEHKDRLGAAIYDTPRDPSFFALSTIRRFLDPFFGEFNLHVADPGFEVEKLAPDIVSSVTLVLPDREASARAAAVRRFMQMKDAYKKKRIWAGVTGLQTSNELDACLSLRVPVIGGPAVSGLAPRPVGARTVETSELPFG